MKAFIWLFWIFCDFVAYATIFFRDPQKIDRPAQNLLLSSIVNPEEQKNISLHFLIPKLGVS